MMQKPLALPALVFAVVFALAACGEPEAVKKEGGQVKQWDRPPEMAIDANKSYRFRIETSAGAMTGQLYPKDAPVTVNNFVFLARQGFYDGVLIHRVLKGFVIQTGDPAGTGSGGPGYQFQDEPVTREYEKGTLAMANRGANTNGSQFFIVLADLHDRLPKDYTIFGQVEEGLAVLDQIAEAEVTHPQGGQEKSRPVKDIFVTKVVIEEG